jgi:hypothetical protein
MPRIGAFVAQGFHSGPEPFERRANFLSSLRAGKPPQARDLPSKDLHNFKIWTVFFFASDRIGRQDVSARQFVRRRSEFDHCRLQIFFLLILICRKCWGLGRGWPGPGIILRKIVVARASAHRPPRAHAADAAVSTHSRRLPEPSQPVRICTTQRDDFVARLCRAFPSAGRFWRGSILMHQGRDVRTVPLRGAPSCFNPITDS